MTIRWALEARGTAVPQREHQEDWALLFEFSAGYGIILKKSIRRWDTGEKVTDAEREVIVQRISDYLKAGGIEKIIIQ